MKGIKDILYVRFAVEDFQKQRTFLEDFGFSVEEVDDRLIARGTDGAQYIYIAEKGENGFLGLGFEAESEETLREIAAIDDVEVKALPMIGGGIRASLTDPDGNQVDIVYGIESFGQSQQSERQPMNFDNDRQRLGERVSFNVDRALVKRLGHCVINVKDFRISEAWYKERIGFITSDEVYIGTEDQVLGAFMRCNRARSTSTTIRCLWLAPVKAGSTMQRLKLVTGTA